MTARDADGLEATQSFEVTVPNRAPVIAGELAPQTLFLGDSVTVDVSGGFSDPDGDGLAFGATSSDTAVAVTTVSGIEVTVRAVARGGTTVTVTARDPDGGEASQDFKVTVPNRAPTVEVPNRAPAATGQLPPQALLPGETVTVDVSAAFSDPDGDPLAFEASSSDTEVAAASAAGSQVTIEGVTAGSASVTISARDPDGEQAVQSFGVTVRLPPPPNRRPVVSRAIPAQTVRENESVSVDLDNHFRDPEGGALNYGATSTDEGVATADISGSDVVVGGVSEGTARVTVTATDPGGLSADHEFGVTVEPESSGNQAPEVTSTIGDRTAIQGGELPVQAYRYFSDPDGNDSNLQYSAGTSNAAVATVRRSNPEVSYVTAVSDGQAVITVTAQDQGVRRSASCRSPTPCGRSGRRISCRLRGPTRTAVPSSGPSSCGRRATRSWSRSTTRVS